METMEMVGDAVEMLDMAEALDPLEVGLKSTFF